MNDEIKRNKILEALVSGRNIEEISKIACVSRKTVYRYLSSDTNLIIEYRNLKREQFRELSEKLSEATSIAIDTIIEISKDKEANQGIRLSASSKILELFMKTREIESNINDKVYRENRNPFEADLQDRFISDYLYPATKVTKM